MTALQLLEELTSPSFLIRDRNIRIRRKNRAYNWESDCPLDLQDNQNSETQFRLEFSLNDVDIARFSEEIGSSINTKLPITISVGRDHTPRFEINKPGKGFKVLSSKSAKIAQFVGSRLSINYIPAVRTARDSAASVEKLVSAGLRRVERTPDYQQALKTIEDLQRPVLDEIENTLTESLKTFLPSVVKVSLGLERDRVEALRSVSVSIDDGQMTPLASKGDGVISLVGMALLSRLDSISGQDVNLILAIEEPESHLHPRAIHAVRSILDNLGADLQVIITTHSPALVNRIDLGANILVENNQAQVVTDIAEIRDALGVRVSDNLQNSRLVILCEGSADDRALSKILIDIEPKLANLFQTAEVTISTLKGSGNLSYMASTLQNSICEPVCFLDDDTAGHIAMVAALKDNVLTQDDFVLTKRLGKTESEFEDLVKDEILAEIIRSKFKADLNKIPSSMRRSKFSDRVKAAIELAGRPWNEQAKIAAKTAVGQKCEELGLNAIADDRRGPFETLASLVLDRLKQH